MDDSLESDIRDLLAVGQKIEAIKVYREATGAGLAEAKTAVESIEAGEPVQSASELAIPELAEQIVDLLKQGQKIEAVKLYREHAGVGLKEAKDIVDEIGARAGIESASRSGCFGVVLLMVGVSFAVGCVMR